MLIIWVEYNRGKVAYIGVEARLLIIKVTYNWGRGKVAYNWGRGKVAYNWGRGKVAL